MSGPARKVVVLENSLTEVTRLAGEMAAFGESGGVPPEVVEKANLAVEELVTNIFFHGYGPGGDGVVTVALARDADGLHIEISDSAAPFNPLEYPPYDTSVPPEEREPGGVGIFLARRVADSLEYARKEGLNRVTLRLRC